MECVVVAVANSLPALYKLFTINCTALQGGDIVYDVSGL
jgi:hypothetical protein